MFFSLLLLPSQSALQIGGLSLREADEGCKIPVLAGKHEKELALGKAAGWIRKLQYGT